MFIVVVVVINDIFFIIIVITIMNVTKASNKETQQVGAGSHSDKKVHPKVQTKGDDTSSNTNKEGGRRRDREGRVEESSRNHGR